MDLVTEVTLLPVVVFAGALVLAVSAIVALTRVKRLPNRQDEATMSYRNARRLGYALAGVLGIAAIGAFYASWQALDYMMRYVFNPGN